MQTNARIARALRALDELHGAVEELYGARAPATIRRALANMRSHLRVLAAEVPPTDDSAAQARTLALLAAAPFHEISVPDLTPSFDTSDLADGAPAGAGTERD